MLEARGFKPIIFGKTNMMNQKTLKLLDRCLLCYLQQIGPIRSFHIKVIARHLGISSYTVWEALERLVHLKLVSFSSGSFK